jgi:hypothetical protein
MLTLLTCRILSCCIIYSDASESAPRFDERSVGLEEVFCFTELADEISGVAMQVVRCGLLAFYAPEPEELSRLGDISDECTLWIAKTN